MTPSLLRMRDQQLTTAEAPRSYAQPPRIATLLLPSLQPETAGAETAQTAKTDAHPCHRLAAAAHRPRSRATQPAAKVKVLTLEDLQRGSRSGEATPPRGTTAAATSRRRPSDERPRAAPGCPEQHGPGTASVPAGPDRQLRAGTTELRPGHTCSRQRG